MDASTKNSQMDNNLKKIAILMTIIGFAVLIGYTLFFWGSGYNGKLKAETSGQYGDFIGGLVGTIFSLSAVILVYLTYQTQKAELNAQKEEIRENRKELRA